MTEASFQCQQCKAKLVVQPVGEHESLRFSGSGSGLSSKLEESFLLLEEAAGGRSVQQQLGGSGGGGAGDGGTGVCQGSPFVRRESQGL